MEGKTTVYQFISLLMSLLIVYLIYQTHDYLVSLDHCDCAPKLYSNRLKNIELFYLFISVLGIIMNIVTFSFKGSEQFFKNYIKIMLAYGFVVLIVHTLFVYNAFMFNHELKSNCECTSKHWEKDFIIIQAVVYGLPIFLIVLGLSISLILTLMKTISGSSPLSLKKK